MTKVIAAVKNCRITESIKEKFSTIFNAESQKTSDSKKIIRSKNMKSDEYGYFNRMENL